jgi:hypothetical protein
MARLALPKLSDLLFLSIFSGCLAVGSRMLNVDSDLGRHLVLGNWMLETRNIPVTDLLSFTRAGESRPPYEWLAQVSLALVDRLWSLDGVVLLSAIVIATAFLLVFLASSDRSGAPVLALVIAAWAAVASSLHWLTRPHVFSFVFLALWMYALERLRAGNKSAIWWLALLMLVWANTHGGFILGFLAWAAYLAGWLWQTWRGSVQQAGCSRLLAAGAVSFAASVLTPDLWRNWGAVLQNRSLFILGRTAETRPADFSLTGTWPFLGLLAMSMLLLAINRRRLAASHIFLLAGFAIAGIAIGRNIPYFSIVSAPILTVWLRQSVSGRPRWLRVEGAIASIDSTLRGFAWPSLAVISVLAVLSLRSGTGQGPLYTHDPARYPVHAVEWIRLHMPRGQMFNEINWGGYLLHQLWPEKRVFIDSQTDFYGEEFVRPYEQAMLGRGDWNAYMQEYEAAWMIIPTSSALSAQVDDDIRWQRSYEDPIASVFVHAVNP